MSKSKQINVIERKSTMLVLASSDKTREWVGS